MAGESLINLTEGSGKKVRTWNETVGGNAVETEWSIQRDPVVASYALSWNAASVATANSHLIELMAGGTLNVYVHRIAVYQLAMATTAAVIQLELRRLTSAGTGGTAFTPVQQDTTDVACGATGMTLPTAAGTEGTPPWRGAAYFMQTVGASAQLLQPIIDINYDQVRGVKPLRITAGTANGLAVKNLTAVAAATVVGTIWFCEQAF